MWGSEGCREKRLYFLLLGEIYAETMGSASLGIRQSSQGLISLRDAYEPKVVIGVLYTWQANTFLRAENEMSIIDYD